MRSKASIWRFSRARSSPCWGWNGAGKTTLGDQHHLRHRPIPARAWFWSTGTTSSAHFRAARAKIGLVPQELSTDGFETVWATTTFSRGLFGKAKNPAHIEQVLRALSLWDKKDSSIMTLSGGMKRRVMIAKALSHEPKILSPGRAHRRGHAVELQPRRYVGDGAGPARHRRHHHPDHPLYRGGRGDGRPGGRDPPGRDRSWSRTRSS